MRDKEDMRDKRVCTKKKKESKKDIWEKEKLSVCYGCGSQCLLIYQKKSICH